MGQAPKEPRANLGWTLRRLRSGEALIVVSAGRSRSFTAATGPAPSTAAACCDSSRRRTWWSQRRPGSQPRRTVADEEKLLDTYAAAAGRLRTPESIRVGVLWRNPARGVTDLGARLSAKGVAWNTTGALAADCSRRTSLRSTRGRSTSTVAPWPNYGRSRVRPEWSRPMVAGSCCGHSRRPQRTGSAPRRLDNVAAWPRVFSDLRMLGVRGEEAAEHLREQMGAEE